MLTLPINANTFKKSFLDGDGNFEISTDQDNWKTLYDLGKPFSRDVQDLVDLKFSAGTTKDLQFGEKNSLKIGVGFSSQILGHVGLVWPGEDNDLIKKYELKELLTANKLYAVIDFNGKADVSAKGSTPLGPLSATFGIGAGGHVGYNRLVLYDNTQSVKDVLTDLFGGVRLPQNIDSPADVPETGEILATSYGGYLNLSAGLSWGYSFKGTRSIELRDLSLALDYAVNLKAAVSIGYNLAGEFELVTRRGSDAGWVRIVVHKNRKSKFDFAADFGLTAKADLKGLPESADEFLAAALGADAKTFLGYFAKAQDFTSLDELEKLAGKFSKGLLHDLAGKWINKVLDDSTVKEFLAAAHKVLEAYQSIDQRIIDLYSDYLDKLPQLDAVLNLLQGLGSRDDLKQLTDSQAWDLIRRLWNDKLHDLLLDDDEFAEFTKFVKQIKEFKDDGANARVRALISEVKKAFPLNDLLVELTKYDTPEELKKLADEKLQGLVGNIIGKAFDEIKDSEFGKVSQKLNATLKSIDAFKNKWYRSLTDAVHQSFAFNLHYGYSSATETDKLLDVEINLNEPAGVALKKKAASGDFVDVLSGYDPRLIKINKGVFTHNLTKSAQVQINVMGWSSQGIVELVQNSEHAIETEPGGLMHVYTIDTYIKQRKESGKKFKEIVQSNFLLRAVGEAFQPVDAPTAAINADKQYVLTTLRNMSVQYDLLEQDDRTNANELSQYLKLGEFLGLIPDRQDFAHDLDSQFPHGLGKVKIDYVVRYDDQAVRNAFTLSGSELENFARATARALIGAKFTGMRKEDWQVRVGFAYLDPQFSELHKKGTLKTDGKFVELPPWFTGSGSITVALPSDQRNLVNVLFNMEDNYVKRLVKLDEVVDQAATGKQPVPVKELEDDARHFVESASEMDFARENTFFAMFDILVKQGGSGKGRRQSAMVMEITPPQGDKVTKYLMA
jgi:hypothetical protein